MLDDDKFFYVFFNIFGKINGFLMQMRINKLSSFDSGV
jgi:hypothetical protein